MKYVKVFRVKREDRSILKYSRLLNTVFITLAVMIFGSFFFPYAYTNIKTYREQQRFLDRERGIRSIRVFLREHLGREITQNRFPSQISTSGLRGDDVVGLVGDHSLLSPIRVKYTLDESLQREAQHLLNLYHPDFGAVVVMEALTGRVLCLVSFQKDLEGEGGGENLALKSNYPAASIFKIITSTAAIDRYRLSPDTRIFFNGGNHTLYKRNILNLQVNRWTREMSLREAFARSINTFFGRLTFEHLNPLDIDEYAKRFGFNRSMESDFTFEMGSTNVPKEKNFELAEIVSGFNRTTRMSPIHGVLLASAVVGDGHMPIPYLVDGLSFGDGDSGVDIPFYSGSYLGGVQVMSRESSEQLRLLMEETVLHGTSRKAFRSLVRDPRFEDLELGGKTGSLWGDSPKGKVDWFVGYAMDTSEHQNGERSGGPRIAVSVITVHKKKWTVKSAFLAQSLLKEYFINSMY